MIINTQKFKLNNHFIDSGDLPLFQSLEQHIVTAIPNDTCEWKRSYGRPVKNVRVETKFQTFDTKLLELYKNGEWSILENPVLHIYVTECSVSFLEFNQILLNL